MIFSTEHYLSQSSSFGDLADWYFDTIAPRHLKEHTIFNNRLLLKNYVIPYIGDLPVQKITPVMVDDLLTCLLHSGSLHPGRKLSPSTVKQIRIVTSAVFQTAVRKEVIDRNPVALSTKLRVDKGERAFLDEHACREVLLLCASLTNPQIANAIRLLLLTGLRRGELIGLCWEDIDFQKKELRVRRTVSQFGGRNVVSTPKTTTSERTVILCGGAVTVLKDQKKLQEVFGRQRTAKTASVFTNANGDYLSGSYLNNCFHKMMEKAGMPGYHIHDLRHANASLLINSGVPMKLVSEHLGHASVAVTEEFYAHLFHDSLKITAKVMDKVHLL